MNRFWSLLILMVMLGSFAAFCFAIHAIPPLASAWLPDNYSESGQAIDDLYYLVHGICGLFLLLPGILLSYFVWRFADRRRQSAQYIPGHWGLEAVWTIVPAMILVGLALYQMETWNHQRMVPPAFEVDGSAMVAPPALVQIVARQFDWEIQYRGRDGKFGTVDDVVVENLLVLPDDQPVVMRLESRDVIHSFFVPKLRLKQDMVPGLIQEVWFKPIRRGTMSMVCAELCGWGHYKMTGELRIVSRAEFQAWMAEQQQRVEGIESSNPFEGRP